MERLNTVVVGGGPAGIGVAASLGVRGIDTVILEKAETVAPAWRSHYERLHLHTNKQASGLPLTPMPSSYPRYPSRDQVWSYLDAYARQWAVDVRLGSKVENCSRDGSVWITTTVDGKKFESLHLVVATGLSHTPSIPDYPGMEEYRGEVLHSAHYRNGHPYSGEAVLVVGFGNSAGEIALDLFEYGAEPHLSIRNPSVVVPRDILGVPVLTIARWLSVMPPRLADTVSKPILRLTIGDIRQAGITPAEQGPLELIATSGKIPLLDIGTIAALRRGEITPHSGIGRFTESGVEFTDGTTSDFTAVVFGTGYVPAVNRILSDVNGVLDESGRPRVSGGHTAIPGLYFCGFREPPTGRLREIGLESERIAELIADASRVLSEV